MTLLVRLVPVTFGVWNMFMSAMEISLGPFMVATLIDLISMTPMVFVGTQIKDVDALLRGDLKSMPKSELIALAIGLTIGITSSITITILTMRAIRREKAYIDAISEEDERTELTIITADDRLFPVSPFSGYEGSQLTPIPEEDADKLDSCRTQVLDNNSNYNGNSVEDDGQLENAPLLISRQQSGILADLKRTSSGHR